jgi:hypothetical protein
MEIGFAWLRNLRLKVSILTEIALILEGKISLFRLFSMDAL